VYWSVSFETMREIIEGTVDSLSAEDYVVLAAELDMEDEESQLLSEEILQQLLARATEEKIHYAPFDFTHFRYSLGDMTVYAQVLERTGLFSCAIKGFSDAAPFGETGEVNTDIIESTMSSIKFAQVCQQKWPSAKKQSQNAARTEANWDICSEIAEEAGISYDEAEQAAEALLAGLHRRLVEYRGLNGDYLGEMAHMELPERAFYHLLGFVEQFSTKYSWEKGIISEYLGRLPPVERWYALAEETSDWTWRRA
jgi:hypothetical protein